MDLPLVVDVPLGLDAAAALSFRLLEEKDRNVAEEEFLSRSVLCKGLHCMCSDQSQRRGSWSDASGQRPHRT